MRGDSPKRAAVGTAGWLLRAALLVSLWNAPIPWIHFHGTLADANGGVSNLSQHLARFHATANAFGSVAFGWHVHYILPWSVSDDGPHPVQGQPDDFRDVAAGFGFGIPAFDVTLQDTAWQGALTAEAHALAATHSAAALPTAQEILRPLPVPRTAHFLQAGSVALRDLICVTRC